VIDVVSGVENTQYDTLMNVANNGDFTVTDFSKFLEYKIRIKVYNSGIWSSDDTDFIINLKIWGTPN